MNPRLYALLSSVGFLIWACLGCDSGKQVPAQNPPMESGAASLAVDKVFSVTLVVKEKGQPPLRELQGDCPPQSTLLGWMEQLKQKGQLQFTHRGSGELAFVESLEGIGGSAADRRGWWTYRINGEVIKQSCGAVLLKPQDRVEWTFSDEIPFEKE